MSEKILVIGKGFLGNAIFSVANEMGFNVLGTHYSKSTPFIDITNFNSVDKITNEFKPDFIINCGAITNLDDLERVPTLGYDVNAYGARNIAQISKKYKIKMIHISTDGIFNGIKGMYDENDVPDPINEYARSKKLGEDLVKQILDDYIVIRTNFYGYHNGGKFLFNWILDNLRNGKQFTGFYDVIFNPLEITNLSIMIMELLETNFSGLLHLSSDQIMSKYEFAVTIARELQYDTELVVKGSIRDAHFIASRPLNTSLSNKKAMTILKTRPLSLEYWLQTKKFLN